MIASSAGVFWARALIMFGREKYARGSLERVHIVPEGDRGQDQKETKVFSLSSQTPTLSHIQDGDLKNRLSESNVRKQQKRLHCWLPPFCNTH